MKVDPEWRKAWNKKADQVRKDLDKLLQDINKAVEALRGKK